MKASEINIGDTFFIDGHPRTIEMVTKKKVGYHIKEHECKMHYARLCEIVPIPITVEILEKNGFSKEKPDLAIDPNFKSWSAFHGRIFVNNSFSNMEERDWSIHVDSEDYSSIGNADIQYVHQLQQVIRFFKIDKEIEL